MDLRRISVLPSLLVLLYAWQTSPDLVTLNFRQCCFSVQYINACIDMTVSAVEHLTGSDHLFCITEGGRHGGLSCWT